MSMSPETVFEFELFQHTIDVTSSVVTQWFLMAVIIVLVLVLTRNLKRVPDKKQSILEMIVTGIDGLVVANMGKEYRRFFVPYIGGMAVYLAFLNTSGLIGIEPATKDINVTLTFALLTFLIVNINSIRVCGIGGFLKEFVSPYPPMLPLNLIEKLTVPFSLCLRLFCNMLVGAMVIELVYEGMGHFAFIAPIPLHFFFDVFDGLIQVFVFMMLTMVYTKIAASHAH